MSQVRGRAALLGVGIAAALALALAASASRPPQAGRVWFWFKSCGGPRMTLQVRLDGATIFGSSFPICKGKRSSISRAVRKKHLNFTFKPSRAIVWKGYRDSDNTSRPGQAIKGSIWLAGSDPDDLVLGLVFMTRNSIYMNTIHIAHPGKRDQTEIEPGLAVTTYPAKLGKEH